MNVDVRYFASLIERAGRNAERVELPAGSDVRALWDELVRRHPSFADLPFRPLIACDLEYADWETGLDGVGEVAFLPPVSGG